MLESTLAKSKNILAVKYSTDLSGVPLPMNPEIMHQVCEAFTASRSARQLAFIGVDITTEVVASMTPLFEPHSGIEVLQMQDCKFVFIFCFYYIIFIKNKFIIKI